MRGIKHSTEDGPALDLWIEQKDRSWRKLGAIDGLMWPKVFSVGSVIGVLGSMGKDLVGGYGNAIRFCAVSIDGKIQEPVDVARPESANERLTISSVHASKEALSAFLLMEKRGEKNALLYVRSTDGGKTWTEPQRMGETTMHEDNSRLGSIQWSAEHLGRFVVERDGQMRLYRSRDAGRSWEKETIVLRDDLGEGATRMPLGSVQFKGGQGMVYLGLPKGQRGQGTYYFTKSVDEAKTWGEGVAIAGPLKMEDPSVFVQLAALEERVAVSYIEVKGQWSRGEMACRLAFSDDGGEKWTPVPLEKFYRGVALFSTLAADPSQNRILFSTSICMDPSQNKRNHLAVQEFSTRALPDTPTEAEIAALIQRLGDVDFQSREEASRRLAAIGRTAKDALLRATQSDDPEVKARAAKILESSFPECLRFDVER